MTHGIYFLGFSKMRNWVDYCLIEKTIPESECSLLLLNEAARTKKEKELMGKYQIIKPQVQKSLDAFLFVYVLKQAKFETPRCLSELSHIVGLGEEVKEVRKAIKLRFFNRDK